MKVCLDVSQSVYEGTGSGRYVIELVKGLLRQPEKHDFKLFGSAMRHYSRLAKLGKLYRTVDSSSTISECYLPLPPSFFEKAWNQWQLLSIDTLVGNQDIYHSSDWTQSSSRSKKITTVHDLIPFLFSEYVHPRIRQAHELRWKHIVAQEVEIIVDAQSTKRDILERFALPDERIHVIPLGCSQRFFEVGREKLMNDPAFIPKQNRVLDAYGLASENYILSVGTLEPRKNIQRLVEAYLHLDQALQQHYKLVIVGKKAWAADLPQSENVLLTGYVDDQDLPYLYSGARCFAMPSLYEGFGIPVLEAMACATAVVCSQRSSLPEIGGNDVHYIQSPENFESIAAALAEVLTKDKRELEGIVKSGFERVSVFTWDRTARETLEVYKHLCE
jgi:alpha-1,3-rhamnosyl/mannosyltransferase